MSERYRPSEQNIHRLKETIAGFCAALQPPRVFLPSQTKNRWFEATAQHERAHAILIASTTYGLAEQILTYLIRVRCPHIRLEYLEQAHDQCIRNSFVTHEGCATSTELYAVEAWRLGSREEFLSELPDDYKYALSRILTAVNPFGFQGYLESWLAMQVVGVCLSPPLFGPLWHFDVYQIGSSSAIFANERFSADLRLERIIEDGHSRRIDDLINEVRLALYDSVANVFFTAEEADFEDDLLRQRFVQTCGPLVDKCFAKAYPEFYIDSDSYSKQFPAIRQELLSDFLDHGCDCLERLPFRLIDLRDQDGYDNELIRPVALPIREGHRGAIELSDLSDLALHEGDQYYIGLHFCEKPEPELICSDPLRILHEGHLYVRLQRLYEAKEGLCAEDFYWFIFYVPDQIPGALSALSSIPNIAVCPACGEPDRVIARAVECSRYGFGKVYVQIDAITAEQFAVLVEELPGKTYDVLLLSEESFRSLVLILKASPPLFDLVFAVTAETANAILTRLIEHTKLHRNSGRKPEPSDVICARHLFMFGW